MAFLTDEEEIYKVYNAAKLESVLWRKDYHEYERLADNGLLDDLDENLPEVNDGSLAASLFKLPKRIVSSKLKGFAKAMNRDDTWINELANITWQTKIVPNANTMASFTRKWKDAVRKSAMYGSVPLITLFVDRGNYTGSDFIVVQPQDVTLEPGKVSDYDSDIIFWDVYYSDLQLQSIIDQAKKEEKDAKKTGKDGYNKWNIPELKKILKTKQKDERSSQDEPKEKINKAVEKGGYHFCIVFQRGVNAPFYMYHKETKTTVREWTNPDPTGDVPVHLLYCYQDFINPYGIGIVKLAGGTQNVLDYMRQADVLATQLGFRPPVSIGGDTSDTDLDSIIYAQDQQWLVGNASVKREEISNQIYSQLPARVSMYKTSLNQLIPTGDTSITQASSGDPNMSKTPAGVKFQQANLSIDDEDYKDNLFVTYEAVARSMINTHFANMQGSDVFKLTDEEKEKIYKTDPKQFAPFMDQKDPQTGEVIKPATNELEVIWDNSRAKFEFTIDPTSAINATDQEQAANIQEVLKSITLQVSYYMSQDGWKFNIGEAYRSLLTKMNLENIDEILTKMTDEEKAAAQKAPFPIIDPPNIRLVGQVPNSSMNQALSMGGVYVDPSTNSMQEQVDLGDIYKDPSTGPNAKAEIQNMAGIQQPDVIQPTYDPNTGKPIMPGTDPYNQTGQPQQGQPAQPPNTDVALSQPPQDQQPVSPQNPDVAQSPPPQDPAQHQANIEAIMKAYKVDQHTAEAMLQAEQSGFNPEEIIQALQRKQQGAPHG